MSEDVDLLRFMIESLDLQGYMGVDMERVWEYLTTDLPALRRLVERELG